MVSVVSFFPKDAFWGGITAVCLPAICKRYSCAINTSSHPSVFGVLRAKIYLLRYGVNSSAVAFYRVSDEPCLRLPNFVLRNPPDDLPEVDREEEEGRSRDGSRCPSRCRNTCPWKCGPKKGGGQGRAERQVRSIRMPVFRRGGRSFRGQAVGRKVGGLRFGTDR